MPEEKESTGLCTGCLSKISPLTPHCCSVCGTPFHSSSGIDHVCGDCIKNPPEFTWLRSLFWYHGPIRDLVCDLKFRFKFHTLNAIGALTRKTVFLEEFNEALPQMTIVPIPVSRSRMQERGFNQALLMAREIFPGQTVSYNLLTRKREVRQQASLSLEERQKNVRGSFLARDGVRGRKILLFDDVFTTGSTIKEATRTLLAAGAVEVRALTFARTPKKEN